MTDPRNLESSRDPTKGFDRDQRQIDPKSTLIVSSSAPNMELNGKGPENNGYSIKSKVNRSQKRDRKGHRGQGMSSLTGSPQNMTHAKPSTDPMERINPGSTTYPSLQWQTCDPLAEVTCLTCFLWFEKYSTLRLVENATHTPRPQSPLVSDAIPTTIFRDWLTYILWRTGVSRNVTLLALMFIYRLRKLNPRLRAEGSHSEFRIVIVALMLGNKGPSALHFTVRRLTVRSSKRSPIQKYSLGRIIRHFRPDYQQVGARLST